MHWPAYDLTTWGLIISIVALILAFPVSLLANLVTPKVKNWWAERSVEALRKRIQKLEADYTDISRFPLFSWIQYNTFNTLHDLAKLLALSVHILIGAATFPPNWQSLSWRIDFRQATVTFFLAANFINYWVTTKSLRRFIHRSSPLDREIAKETISRLQAELTKKTGIAAPTSVSSSD